MYSKMRWRLLQMFNLESNCSVYLIPGYTDMRKGILTLSQLANSIVDNKFFSGSLFIFCSKRKDTLKIVYWDMNGFCMWQKKLDKDRFWWPKESSEVKEVSIQQLRWMLDGLNPLEVNGYRSLNYQTI